MKRNRIKKLLALMMATSLMTALFLTGCGGQQEEPPVEETVETEEAESKPIAGFEFDAPDEIGALGENAIPGGVVGSFSARGGDGANYSYVLMDSTSYGKDNGCFKIEGDKLIVDKLLEPGFYEIYVQVSSGGRDDDKSFNFKVVESDSELELTEDIFSGSNGEWFVVDCNQVNHEPNLKELKAVSDGTNLYGYVSAEELSETFEAYIGVVDGTGADVSTVWENAKGVSFKMDASGKIYEYDGEQWADTGKTAAVYRSKTEAEFKIAISDLTDTASAFYVGVMEGEGSMLPSKGRAMMEVTSPIMEAAPVITADGDPSDWEGMEPITKGSGSIGDLYAVRTNDYLYVMSHVSSVDTEYFQGFSTNLYINTDNNGATGYIHNGYPVSSGAEFLVQDWCSIANESYTPCTEYFYHTDDSSDWAWQVQESGVDFKASVATDKEGVYCIEFAVPLEALKKAVPSFSDNFYIAIDREWLEDSADVVTRMPLGYAPAKEAEAFAKVPKYQTTCELSLEDSSFSDWKAVVDKVENTSEDTMYNMLATRSQERLYTLVTSEYKDFTTDNTYYLDTVAGAGYTVDSHDGVDYVVKEAGLYKVEGKDSFGEEICKVEFDYYADSIEMQIYLEDLGNPETISVAYAGKGYDGNTYDDKTVPNKEIAIPKDNEYLAVTASFEMQREEGLYYPKESFESFANPYKGWVGWANSYGNSESAYDYNMEYVGIKWREFEPEKGVYDFEALDALYSISEIVEAGKRINIRFIMDNPDSSATGKCMDIPQWLYDELVAEHGEEGAGTFYYKEGLPGGITGSEGCGFSPNYNSELLIEYHDKAIAALAEYFDDPSVVSFVQFGSLGHWGEIHTWPEGTGEFVSPQVLERYLQPYLEGFKNVKIGIRKPYPAAAKNGLGLFNDIFGVSEWGNTRDFVNWTIVGCTDMGGGATAEDVEASKMPDFWKTNYSGGEFASGNVRLHLTDPGTIGCLQQVRDAHTSWLGPCSAAGFYSYDKSSYDYKVNVDAMVKLMGYRFNLRYVTQYDEVAAGTAIDLDMCWDNKGVAPMYYNWPVEISLIGEDGTVVYSESKDMAINEWLPGSVRKTTTLNVPSDIAAGTYTLAVAVLDPDKGIPSMNLAIDGGNEDLRYPLYQLIIK